MRNSNSSHSRISWPVSLFVLLVALPACANQAAAQVVWIAPNHSVVQIGRPYPVPVGGYYYFNSPVVGPGYQYVRISGGYSGYIINPRFGFGTPVFVKPFTANARIQASNFLRAPQMQLKKTP